MSLSRDGEREQVAFFMRRLYARGLTTSTGGNVSLRASGVVAITPSGTDKGSVQPGDVALLTLEGESLTPEIRVSMEAGMHLAVYRAREDVRAVVHAHPTTASAFAALGRPIDTTLTAESWLLLGRPVKAPYALMGSAALAEGVAQAVRSGDAVLMENHGVLTVGRSLLEAFDRLEVLESAAKMTWVAATLGGSCPLSADRLDEIGGVFAKKGPGS